MILKVSNSGFASTRGISFLYSKHFLAVLAYRYFSKPGMEPVSLQWKHESYPLDRWEFPTRGIFHIVILVTFLKSENKAHGTVFKEVQSKIVSRCSFPPLTSFSPTNSSGNQYLGTHLQVFYVYTYIFYKNVHLVCTFPCTLLFSLESI